VSASREKLGLKLLRALKQEKDSGKTLIDCRTISAIATHLGFSQQELDAALAFLTERQALNAANRPDGRRAALPSPEGEALLAAEKGKTAWTFDRRLTLYTIVISLISLVLVLAGLSRCTQQ
jgi:hypothetical protein